MGRRNRDRIERIRSGLETPIAQKVVTKASRKGVVNELSKGTVADQTDRLSELVELGTIPEKKLKDAIMKNAPKEMDKAIKKSRKKGKPITVESLLAEARSEPRFLAMCEKVGLDYKWFENLARERMGANRV